MDTRRGGRELMEKKYIVKLTKKEREQLRQILSRGKSSALRRLHAGILLKADSSRGSPGWSDAPIGDALEVKPRTVARVRRRFVEEGLEATLERRRQKNRRAKIIDGETEAHLIALTCSEPPEGRVRWTLQLLSEKLVELKYVDSVSLETVRKTLKKTS